ncbi:MAG: class I SAM-dependent methyltransferase, partial [Bacteroidia bacterium]|nr:class I SAM-dependent methyltransferase [Bacteroidia bacterium]
MKQTKGQSMTNPVCPNCSSNVVAEHLSTKDFFLTMESFSIYTCGTCKVLFTHPFPELDVLYSKYYKSEHYLSHNKKSSDLFSLAYRFVQKVNIGMKKRVVERFLETKEKKILEVGAGTGDFLAACKRNGWNCFGLEPSEKARGIATEFNSLKLFTSLDEVKEKNFSVITLWHVLEHIPDLNATIKKLKSMLAEDGLLIIAVPNHNSFDAKHYNKYWAGYDVPRHLYHFNKTSLPSIMEGHGLKLKKIKPMLFDSFYVSLLSEKYKHNAFIVSDIYGVLMGGLSN